MVVHGFGRELMESDDVDRSDAFYSQYTLVSSIAKVETYLGRSWVFKAFDVNALDWNGHNTSSIHHL